MNRKLFISVELFINYVFIQFKNSSKGRQAEHRDLKDFRKLNYSILYFHMVNISI